MSARRTPDPRRRGATASHIEQHISPRPRSMGDGEVLRVLPSAERRMVGPFIFLDHFGPTEMAPGTGMSVGPHPHIGIATVTYLFEGTLLHCDSTGSEQRIDPGSVNWMLAGSGIVHSERTPDDLVASGQTVHGLQLWVALPSAVEEADPKFRHHADYSLPELHRDGAKLRVLLGTAYGVTSPVYTRSPMFYVEVTLAPGGSIEIPASYPERGAYVTEGVVHFGPERIEAPAFVVFEEGTTPRVRAETNARVMLLGGETLDGDRHISWNFVSSSEDRIAKAKQDWADGAFGSVPGDDGEPMKMPD